MIFPGNSYIALFRAKNALLTPFSQAYFYRFLPNFKDLVWSDPTAFMHYIPDVCRDLDIPCINLLGLMRREHWTF